MQEYSEIMLHNFGVMMLIVIIRSLILQADAFMTQRVGPTTLLGCCQSKRVLPIRFQVLKFTSRRSAVGDGIIRP